MSDFDMEQTKRTLEDMAIKEKELSKSMDEMIRVIEEKGKNGKENEDFNLIVGLNESEITVLNMIKEKIENTFQVNFEKLRSMDEKSDSSEKMIQKIEHDIAQLESLIEDQLKTIKGDQNFLFETTEQQKISFDKQKEIAESQFSQFSESVEEIIAKMSGISENLSLIQDNKETISLIKEIKAEINDIFDSFYSELQSIPDQIVTLFDEFNQQAFFSDIPNILNDIDGKIEKIQESQQVFSKFDHHQDALKERARNHSEALSKLSKLQEKILAVLNIESQKITKDDVDTLKKALTEMSTVAGSLSKKEEMIQFEERVLVEIEKIENIVNNGITEQDSILEAINAKIKGFPELLLENSAKSDKKLNELKNEQKQQVDLLKTIKDENLKILGDQKEIPQEFLEAITERLLPILEENQDRYQENQRELNNLREDLKKLGDNQQAYQEESSKLS